MYIDIGVSILKSCKEGFLQYRSLVQQNNAVSLERTINHLVERVEAAGNAELEKMGGADCEQQFESKTLQYEWESFQVVFTILRNNGKLNHVYCAVMEKALAFCLRLRRTKEFKKLNDIVRRRFGYVIHNQQHDYALKINSQETLNAMLRVRLSMLSGALTMGLHQESFKTIKGLQKNIIDRSYDLKKQIDADLHAAFYEKLAVVFWASNRFLLHSYAVFEGYKKMRQHIRSNLQGRKLSEPRRVAEAKLHRLLHEALLSALIVPSSSVNDKNKSSSANPATANNKYFTHSLFQLANDYFGVGRRRQIKPSQQALLHEIMDEVRSIRSDRHRPSKREGSKEAQDAAKNDPMWNAKALYHLMASTTVNPLTFTASLSTIVGRLEAENGVKVAMYRSKVHEKGVTMLLRQLAVCYKSISWDRFSQLTFPKHELSDIELERIITNSVYYDSTGCTISHSARLISFYDNNLESDILSESIVELNRSLMEIKRTKNLYGPPLYAPDPEQRKNVYHTIRDRMVAEHKRFDRRRWEIEAQKRQEAEVKEAKRRQLMAMEAKARAEREAAKLHKLKLAAESKKEIEAKQEEEKQKKERMRVGTTQWKHVIDMVRPTATVKNMAKAKTKRKDDGRSQQQIKDLNTKQRDIQNRIESQLKEGIDEGAIERGMRRILTIEAKKKRKMLQIERTEFDHFCRAQRRYVQKQIQGERDRLDLLDVDQRKRLFKKLNQSKKEQHGLLVQRRNRVRELQEKHLKAFKKIVRDEGRRKQMAVRQHQQQQQQQQQQQRQKQKQQQQPQSKKSKKNPRTKSQSKTQSPSPGPSPRRSQNKPKQSPSPRPSRYEPPKRELPRDPRVRANGSMSNGARSNGQAAPQKMTFAQKMAARRANGGVEAASFRESSFSNKFGRNGGGGGFFGSSRPRNFRRDFDDDDGGGQMIRPKANQ